MPSSAGSSSVSSADSEEFGAVARGGFTRMYVLSSSETSPIDQRNDYRSELELENEDEEGYSDAKHTPTSRREEKDTGEPRFHLLYSSGRHYFHGEIDLPPGVDVALSASERMFDGVSDISANGVALRDLPMLLPHFRAKQDDLMLVDAITSFRSELRDVLYQMEEVGEFFVEELAKPKIAARIEDGAREMHWMVARDNPTFFELQTYPSTNECFRDAGVLLVVMKLVVRGVLLDIVYSRDSYYVTLRDNAEELALEDTFIPNVSCVGPCFEVRQYSDEDLKKLVLWCALPQGGGYDAVSASMPSSHRVSSKIQPMGPTKIILDANDTQLYCILSHKEETKCPRRHDQSKQSKRSTKRLLSQRGDDSDNDDDIIEGTVVFQFNQYVYFGDVRVVESSLGDLAKLSSIGFPYLREQANDLAFFGEHDDLPRSRTDTISIATGNSYSDETLVVFSGVHNRFRDIARVLVDMAIESQSWISNFMSEVRTISSEAADATSSSLPWLGDHLSRWLEIDEGMEAFFELELASGAEVLLPDPDLDEELELLVWKGLVNEALVIVVYRGGSFYLVLRPVVTEDKSIAHSDATDLFGALPQLFSKGRGYLVRKFPPSLGRSSDSWLAGAKLMLWQTSTSIEREVYEEKEQKKRESLKTSNDWFEQDAKGERGDTETTAPKAIVRAVEPVEIKSSVIDSDAKEAAAGAPKSASSKADRVARRHHVPKLQGVDPMTRFRQSGAITPPWDLRTGKPL